MSLLVISSYFTDLRNSNFWLSVISLLGGLLFCLPLRGNLMMLGPLFDQSEFSLKESILSFSSLFLFFIFMISLLVLLWGDFYMATSYKVTLFIVVLFSFVISMFALVVAESFFSIFLGWEGLGISSFILIIFYQNWLSTKGGLLTLLTNRIGDGLLIITFSYWMLWVNYKEVVVSSSFLFLVIVLLTITKSAQWPFSNWLPAAMAAPTPVSALVHSSTLVTAGIWLLIKFYSMSLMVLSILLSLGILTLSMASLAAIMEVDAKKVVALSTLSQLGLMFVSLGLSNAVLCLFHLLMHAIAKANLFLVVGNILSEEYSQQDSRSLSSGTGLTKCLSMSMLISILSLSGMVFISGFFSKELILMGVYSEMTSIMILILMLVISSLTLVYCLKLLLVSTLSSKPALTPLFSEKNYLVSVLTLSSSTLLFGVFMNSSLAFLILKLESIEGLFWSLIMFVSALLLLMSSLKGLYMLFYIQSRLVDLVFLKSLLVKEQIMKTELSLFEAYYYTSGLSLSLLAQLVSRSSILMSVLLLVLLLSAYNHFI